MKIEFEINNLTEEQVSLLEAVCASWRDSYANEELSMLTPSVEEQTTTATIGKEPRSFVDCTTPQMESLLGMPVENIRYLTKKVSGTTKYFRYNKDTAGWEVDLKFFETFPEQLRQIKHGKVLSMPIWFPTSVINNKLKDINLRWGPSTWGKYGAATLEFMPEPESGKKQTYYLTDIRAWKKTRPVFWNTITKSY